MDAIAGKPSLSVIVGHRQASQLKHLVNRFENSRNDLELKPVTADE